MGQLSKGRPPHPSSEVPAEGTPQGGPGAPVTSSTWALCRETGLSLAGSGAPPPGAHGGRIPTLFISCLGQEHPRCPSHCQPSQKEEGPHHTDSDPSLGRNHLPLRPLSVAGSSDDARKTHRVGGVQKYDQRSIDESRGLLHPTCTRHRLVNVGKGEEGR